MEVKQWMKVENWMKVRELIVSWTANERWRMNEG